MNLTHTDPSPSNSCTAHEHGFFIDRCLLAYALAGGAVAVSASTTNAAIISSGPLNITAASWGSPAAHAPGFGFGGNGGTGAPFVLGGSGGNGGVGGSFGWAYDPANNHSLVGIVGQEGSSLQFAEAAPGLAYRFALGGLVAGNGGNGGNGGLLFGSDPVHFAAYGSSNAHVSGMGHMWPAGGTGFVGFRFLNASSNYLYGWIEIRIPTTADVGEPLTLVQWAYQDDPNGVIFAGMTDVPAPGALALVAFAAGAARTGGGRRRSG
jgi:hypothetical protein